MALVNGRISRQSFRRYKLIKFFLRRVLSCLSVAVMQSEADAETIASRWAWRDEKLFTAGNLKFDAEVARELTGKTEEIRKRFGLRLKRAAHSCCQHTRTGRGDHSRKHQATSNETTGATDACAATSGAFQRSRRTDPKIRIELGEKNESPPTRTMQTQT